MSFKIRAAGKLFRRLYDTILMARKGRQSMADSLALVLTSTISPARGASVNRADPELRRKDYMEALAFWLRLSDPRLQRIVFIENSGADLGSFEELVRTSNPHHKEVEFISTEVTEIPEGIQHGWGELRMLDEGLSRSRLVGEATHFVKATGRLVFPSIKRFLNRMPKNFDVLVDCRIPAGEYRRGAALIPALIQRRGAYATTQIAVFRATTYSAYFRDLYRVMQPWTRSGVMECVIFDRLQEIAGEIKIVWRFPVNCDPVGIGARYGVEYQSTSRKIMSAVRAALRPFSACWI